MEGGVPFANRGIAQINNANKAKDGVCICRGSFIILQFSPKGVWMVRMYALIPYYEQPIFEFAGTKIQAWDLFVVGGFLTGVWVAARLSEKLRLDPKVILDFAPWALVVGFSCAHLVHCFAYEPELIRENPWFIFYIWSGLSSFGGFLGAAITLFVFFRVRKANFFEYSEPLAFGMVIAWFIARIGCFIAHDHKGVLSNFVLAVDFPGGARHDLGLYDAILTLGIWIVISIFYYRRPRTRYGFNGGLVCFLYAFVRFFLDYLRATDISRSDRRYLDLTPAQYGCFALALIGLYMIHRSRSEARVGEQDGGDDDAPSPEDVAAEAA